MSAPTRRPRELRGVHVFLMIAAFFAVTIAVDGYFIVRAVATFPGETVPKSYLQGLDYNRIVERRRRQEELGWSAAIGATGAGVVLTVTSKSGDPVEGLIASARVRTPGAPQFDLDLDLTEVRPGVHQSTGPVALAPRSSVFIEARTEPGGDVVFEAHRRVGGP